MLSTPADDVLNTFDIRRQAPQLVPRFNIAPGQLVAVIREPHRLELLRWGLKPLNSSASDFNVHVGALSAPSYDELIIGQRCLVLANGFYEWKVTGEPHAEIPICEPYLLRRVDGAPFAFAGIWDRARTKSGQSIAACAILTTAPRGVAAQVNDRMPVLLPADARMAWLNPAVRYRELLEPEANLELVPALALLQSARNEAARVAVRPQRKKDRLER